MDTQRNATEDELWSVAAEAMNWTPDKCTRAALRNAITAVAPLIEARERDALAGIVHQMGYETQDSVERNAFFTAAAAIRTRNTP